VGHCMRECVARVMVAKSTCGLHTQRTRTAQKDPPPHTHTHTPPPPPPPHSLPTRFVTAGRPRLFFGFTKKMKSLACLGAQKRTGKSGRLTLTSLTRSGRHPPLTTHLSPLASVTLPPSLTTHHSPFTPTISPHRSPLITLTTATIFHS
jgi:hypothetical protein